MTGVEGVRTGDFDQVYFPSGSTIEASYKETREAHSCLFYVVIEGEDSSVKLNFM